MITNIKYLCYVLKTDINSIQNIIDNIDAYYISWEKIKINKDTNLPIIENGKPKTRLLNSTKLELKKIQKRIYKFLLSKVDIPKYAYGGVSKRDNVLNAKYHQGNKYIFTTDLKSYFPSISNKHIFNLFIELGCTPEVSRILTQLTTYKYQLPQGVPTSTLLANLVFQKTGDKIDKYAKENGIKFTSFVDDLTFSSKKCFKDKILAILAMLEKDGFTISHQKTFYKTKNPIITGVTCQNNKIKLGQHHYKRISRLRAEATISSDDIKLQKRHEGLLRYRQRIDLSNK
ncbi:MAG: reverse transcriptase family protein [Marinifilaceae bacterium]